MMRRALSAYHRMPTGPVLLLVFTALSGLGCMQGLGEGYEKQFKVSYVREATEACTRVAVGKGMLEGTARPVCACRAQHLVDHHDSSALTKYSLNMSSPEAQQALKDAAEACPERPQ